MFTDIAKQYLTGLKFNAGTPEHQGMIGSGDNSNWGTIAATNPYITTSNGTIKDLSGDASTGYSFSDNYNDPNGKSEKDQIGVNYSYDPQTGTATPTGSNTYYQPGDWVGQYRDVAKILGTVLAAGAGGAALAGGAGGGGAAGAAGGLATDITGATVAQGAAGAGYGASGYSGLAGAAGGLGGGGLSAEQLAYGALENGTYGGGAGVGGAAGGGGAVGGGASSFGPGAFEFGGAGAGGAGGIGAGAGGGGAAAGAAGSNSGFLSSLASGNWGGAASAAGNWATSPGGLQTLGGLGSAFLQNQSAGKALDAQTNATNSANALQKYMYDTTRADYAPYRALGVGAIGGLNNLLSNPNSITSDPGYKFGLDQGQTAIDRSAASRGGLYSGATLKALNRYGSDYGSTKLNESFNRLASVAQLGATGTAGTANAGQNYANQVGNNTTAQGNAAAGNALYQGNLWGNALNGAISAYTQPRP